MKALDLPPSLRDNSAGGANIRKIIKIALELE